MTHLRAYGTWQDGKYSSNMSSIYTSLIKEAAKCASYSSNILYDIETIENILKERKQSSKTRLIGFREYGTDGNDIINSRMRYKMYETYMSMARIDFVKKNNDIQIDFVITTDANTMRLWTYEILKAGDEK